MAANPRPSIALSPRSTTVPAEQLGTQGLHLFAKQEMGLTNTERDHSYFECTLVGGVDT